MKREMDTLAPWLHYCLEKPALFTSAPTDSPLDAAWQSFTSTIPLDITLSQIPFQYDEAQVQLNAMRHAIEESTAPTELLDEAENWRQQMSELLERARSNVIGLIEIFRSIKEQSESLITATDFDFLFNPRRKLFRIGYNVDTGNRDPNHYDLLASEARIASLLAIGKGEILQSHWLHLGRPLTTQNDQLALLSWSRVKCSST